MKPQLKAVPPVAAPVELIPVNAGRLPSVVESVLQGIRETLRHSRGESTPTGVLASIAAGHRLLWVAISDGQFVGFAITQIGFQESFRELVIYMAWTKPGVPDVLESGLEQLEAYAKSVGCTKVVLYSSRKGMGRRMEGLGFEPHYVEYVKEL